MITTKNYEIFAIDSIKQKQQQKNSKYFFKKKLHDDEHDDKYLIFKLSLLL